MDEPNPNPVPQPDGGGTPAPSGAPLTMPHGLDPKFWDAKAGVKVDDLVKSHGELSTLKAQADERAAAVPATPADYKLELPAEFKVPDGVEIKFDLKDPVKGPILTDALAFAHKNQLGQGQVSELLSLQAKYELATQEANTRALSEQIATEEKKLGENKQARMAAVDSFLKSKLDKAEYEAFREEFPSFGERPLVTSALAFQALEKIVTAATAQNVPGGNPGGGAPPKPADVPIENRWYGSQKVS